MVLLDYRTKTLRYTPIAIGLATWHGIFSNRTEALPNAYSVVPLSRGMSVLVAPSLELLSDLPVKRCLILEEVFVVGKFGLGAATGPTHFSGQRPGYFFLDTRNGQMEAALTSQEMQDLLLQNKLVECESFPKCDQWNNMQ